MKTIIAVLLVAFMALGVASAFSTPTSPEVIATGTVPSILTFWLGPGPSAQDTAVGLSQITPTQVGTGSVTGLITSTSNWQITAPENVILTGPSGSLNNKLVTTIVDSTGVPVLSHPETATFSQTWNGDLAGTYSGTATFVASALPN